MEPAINVILIGRSGAGKSSLANYLYGQKLFETGEGAPVTKFDKPWQMATIRDNQENFNINIYDTPGLEPNNFNEWENNIEQNLKKRDKLDEPENWIHGAFYVINAASQRIENTELKIIRDFPQKYYFPISIALTNCDAARENEIESYEKFIKDNIPSIHITRICSIKRIKRGDPNNPVEPFGKSELLKDHARQVAFYYTQKIGCLIFNQLLPSAIDNLCNEGIKLTNEANLGLIDIILHLINKTDPLYFLDELDEKFKNEKYKIIQNLGAANSYLKNVVESEFSLPDMDAAINEIDMVEEFNMIKNIEGITNIIEKIKINEKIKEKAKETLESMSIFIFPKTRLQLFFMQTKISLKLNCDNKYNSCLEHLRNPHMYINGDTWYKQW